MKKNIYLCTAFEKKSQSELVFGLFLIVFLSQIHHNGAFV